ncbi:murein L,D-transpeptidase [Halomonas sp. DQ26W]|uniref:L,D-transpeptidase n=1 Tax=Halomonas sp. DQ26W TaxID=2282311 RepID=UPI000DF7C96F|nr:L,D-transpeptidase [Halomonas sp. DQ26W]RDB44564.1 murein L,D-transpeptidase [Halomonas sp. DQ26W]
MNKTIHWLAACVAALAMMGSGAAQANFDSSTTQENGVDPVFSQAGFLHSLDALAMPAGLASDEIWVNVDLKSRLVTVYRGEYVMKRIEHLAYGAGGAAPLRAKGSSMTPLGEFRVDRINRASRFELFFGIDYPNAEVASEALRIGKITPEEYHYIETYRARTGRPPHTTALGGLIGLHGLGSGDPDVHRSFDWTEGCVAVDNYQIRALDPWLNIGTRVVIRG